MNLFEPITNEDIQNLPLKSFEGTIHVIDTQEACAEALTALKRTPIIGFDTETKPAFVKGSYFYTAIVQLSTTEDAYLFRLKKIPNLRPLYHFLEDASYAKVGISIADDLKDLRRVKEFVPGGFIELNDIAQEVGIKHIGVKKLAAICLDYRISKSQQTSNWENETLTLAQQKYAATDAWVCLAIYHKLSDQGYIA